MTDDLDRLLELRDAKHRAQEAEEREVDNLNRRVKDQNTTIDNALAKIQATEERAEHWQRECERQRADNQLLRDVAEAARAILGEVDFWKHKNSKWDPPRIPELRDALQHYDEAMQK